MGHKGIGAASFGISDGRTNVWFMDDDTRCFGPVVDDVAGSTDDGADGTCEHFSGGVNGTVLLLDPVWCTADEDCFDGLR